MTATLRLGPDCSLKLLEDPCLYDRHTDELYVVSPDSVEFLKKCATGAPRPAGSASDEFVDYCLSHGLMREVEEPAPRRLRSGQAPSPSLRYLLMHITDRCNLRCHHCFLGEAGHTDLPLEDIKRVIDEFERLQGLRLIVSGGEPLLHPDFWEINDYVAGRDVRPILLTNGTLISEESARRLRFQEVQVSLDGMKAGHEFLRGPGSFDQAMRAIKHLAGAEVQLSVATMIHRNNLLDLHYMAGLMHDLGVRQWSVDQPSSAGRLQDGAGVAVDPLTAGPLLDYSYGGAIHEPVAGYACGAHLMAVMAGGAVARCGFYSRRPVGTIGDGLKHCWDSIERIRLEELECDCRHLETCRGGCRFRAAGYNDVYAPDACQCFRYGVKVRPRGAARKS